MDSTAVIASVLALAVLLLTRVNVGLALLCSGGVGLVIMRELKGANDALATVPFADAAHYTLIVIPMFMVMGVMARESGMATEMFASICASGVQQSGVRRT